MDVVISAPCVSGQAKPNTFLKFVVRDSIGNQKGRDAVAVDSTGAWEGCLDFFADPLTAGDRINVLDFETGQTLSVTVPRLTIDVNRVTDVVSGKAPVGMKLAIEASDSSGPLYGHQPYDITRHVVANATAAYAHDFGDDGVNLIGGAALETRISMAGGNVHFHRQLTVPGLAVSLGRSTFGGYIEPYAHIGVTLSVSGAQVARGDAVGDAQYAGEFEGTFVDSDREPYLVRGGETLRAPALGGAAWHVPTINASVDTTTDKISATCFANSPYVVLVGFFGFESGTTGANGHFTVDMSNQLDLIKGDDVVVACLRFSGDYVQQELTAK
jgi:hypothetical protein